MRFLIGGFKHELSSFVSGETTLLDVARQGFVVEGPAIFGPATGSGFEHHAAAAYAAAHDIELVPGGQAWGGAGPRLTEEAYEAITEPILSVARREAGRLDGIYLTLHGAVATTRLDDVEGDFVERLRAIVGPEIPIVASFDLHGHCTDAMVRGMDAIVAFETCPHTDYYETGLRSIRLLHRAASGEVRLTTVQRKLRLGASAERHDTTSGPMVAVMQLCREAEQEPGILCVSVFATQPWMDVTEYGWSVVVVTDGDEAAGQAVADRIARYIWEHRDDFLVHKTPIAEAVAIASATDGRPVVFAEGSDSPSAGASGDGTDLLRVLVHGGSFAGTALLTVTDPAGAEACAAAGVGAELELSVGGQLTPDLFTPVALRGIVERVSDGRFTMDRPVRPIDLGTTALVRAGNVAVVVTTRPAWHLDWSIYRHVGLDPRDFDVVLAKSAGGYRAAYDPIAARIVELDVTGPCDSDLTRLPFRRIPRPLWPFDPELDAPWGLAGGPGVAGDGARRGDGFDLIVVGAGVFGLSTALEAAERGLRVAVLDSARVPHARAASFGPSRKIKSTYLNATYARLGVEAMAGWERIERDAGERLFVRAGNLVYATGHDAAVLDALQRTSEAAGGVIERLDAAELRRRYPQFRLARTAIMEPAAGFLRATAVIAALAARARGAGIELMEETTVDRLEVDGARPGVRCGDCRLDADRLVVAAGVWTSGLLPVLRDVITLKRQGNAYIRVVPAGFDAAGFPPFSVAETNFYGFPAWNGEPVKLGWHDHSEIVSDPETDRTTATRVFLDASRAFAAEHLGLTLADDAITGASCLYDVTPTTDFLVDFLPGSENVLLVTGGSGHGFKFGSVIGRIAMDRLDRIGADTAWSAQFAWDRVTMASAPTALPLADPISS